jgi:hypothetical protein
MFLETKPIIMKLVTAKLTPVMIVKLRIRILELNLLRVDTHIRVNSAPESEPDTKGESTQLAAVAPTFYQLRFSAPTPASPAPTNAPTSA